MTTKLLFLAGSARKDSLNKKLAKNASAIAETLGADSTFIDLADFDMPIYNGDWEEENGLPDKAIALKELFIAHDGFFIASPEYNSSFSSLLKNTLDWVSRTHQEGEAPLMAYAGKVAAICAASPGGLGGLRGLVPLRMMLSNINVTVIPQQMALPSAFDMFDEDGNMKDAKQKKMLTNVMQALMDTTTALKG